VATETKFMLSGTLHTHCIYLFSLCLFLLPSKHTQLLRKRLSLLRTLNIRNLR